MSRGGSGRRARATIPACIPAFCVAAPSSSRSPPSRWRRWPRSRPEGTSPRVSPSSARVRPGTRCTWSWPGRCASPRRSRVPARRRSRSSVPEATSGRWPPSTTLPALPMRWPTPPADSSPSGARTSTASCSSTRTWPTRCCGPSCGRSLRACARRPRSCARGAAGPIVGRKKTETRRTLGGDENSPCLGLGGARQQHHCPGDIARFVPTLRGCKYLILLHMTLDLVWVFPYPGSRYPTWAYLVRCAQKRMRW
jgi:hypothetical protein